jgi:hypothetical protein
VRREQDIAVVVSGIDWDRVRWELQEICGMALRHVTVNPEYQHALDKRGVISIARPTWSDLGKDRCVASRIGQSLRGDYQTFSKASIAAKTVMCALAGFAPVTMRPLVIEKASNGTGGAT